ncbi:MAG: AtzH-like domain-containing protein, partial [Sphingobium sp.]
MIIDDPLLLAEITHAFHEYERALMEDDVPAMDALFHDAPTTNRYGVGEVLYGIEEIRTFRKGRGGSPQRKLG